MSLKPTIKVHSADKEDVDLTVWPAIPSTTTNPAIQIDWRTHGGNIRSMAVEYRKEDAAAIAAAIIEAAEKSA